jgi:hypothetical protein
MREGTGLCAPVNRGSLRRPCAGVPTRARERAPPAQRALSLDPRLCTRRGILKVRTPKDRTPKDRTPEVHTPKVHTPKVHTPKVRTPKDRTSRMQTLLRFRTARRIPRPRRREGRDKRSPLLSTH